MRIYEARVPVPFSLAEFTAGRFLADAEASAMCGARACDRMWCCACVRPCVAQNTPRACLFVGAWAYHEPVDSYALVHVAVAC